LPTELTADTAPGWLAAHDFPVAGPHCAELGGGVSNRVVLAEAPGFRAVLKQSMGRLRVEREWLSDRSRVFREASAMRWLAGRVRGGRVPALLCEDPGEFTIAMEAAPPAAETWKARLFAREPDPAHARAAGTLLGSIVAASWHDSEAGRLFGDQTVFDQLRIDPYYRFTASLHPACKPYFDRLIERSQARRVSLVHGDWSPKNLLIAGSELWAIDWEVVHFGDPSFDAGFLLNHLLLKSVAMPAARAQFAELAHEFLTALNAELPNEARWIEAAALEHLPALLLARVDGKSPAEYLDQSGRQRARETAISLMQRPTTSIREAFHR
jgi:5-methylthioribose kinase